MKSVLKFEITKLEKVYDSAEPAVMVTAYLFNGMAMTMTVPQTEAPYYPIGKFLAVTIGE
jgi:hypothetical protein